MSRKPASRSKRIPRPTAKAQALLARAAAIRDPPSEADLIALAEHRVQLEELLADLANAVDQRDWASEGARRSSARGIKGDLPRAESRLGKMVLRIEGRIARTPANTVEQAVLKLMIYGTLQGYDLNGSRQRREVVAPEQRLFLSVLDDLKRLTRTDRNLEREQSSDQKRSIKRRK